MFLNYYRMFAEFFKFVSSCLY